MARSSGTPSKDARDGDAAFRAHAELLRVLGDPKRLRLVDSLRSGERCVGELAVLLGVAMPNASQHLALLRAAGLVGSRREGATVYYRLVEPRIAEACDVVHEIVADRERSARPGAERAPVR